MSDGGQSFMALALDGEVLAEEIDDFVDRWHDGESEQELHEFLGMSLEEFSLWVSNPELISLIIAARHRRQPILAAVNDNYDALDRIAARTDQPRKLAILKRWIEQQRESGART